MGANNSAPVKPITFYSETPLQFSQDLVESLEASSTSNAQRTVSLTASLEKRVHDDLAELERASDEALQTALSTASSTPSKNDTSVNPRSELEAKIAEMKEKLDGSVKLGTKAAEEARSEVLRCLVEKDRRPLECAEAVRKFREEARRVEKEWVEKVL